MIQVYTGAGKGKTTAALGLALRAAGRGIKVYIGQFLKKGDYGETRALKKFRNVTVRQFGSGCFVRARASGADKRLAQAGLKKIRREIQSGRYGMVVLDEVNAAVSCGVLSEEEVCGFLRDVPCRTEVVLTGRNAPAGILKHADLITVMQEKRHYYRKGVKAREGIEY